MSTITTITVGGSDFTEYRVRHQAGCILIFGDVPADAFITLAKLAHRRAVMCPDLARMAGATLAFGLRSDIDALTKELKPDVIAATKSRYDLLKVKVLSPAEIEWLAAGERGASSDALFQHLTEVDVLPHQRTTTHHPHDPADLRRCLLLLEKCPELAERFSQMRSVSKEWASLVDVWPKLRAEFESEAPNWRDPKSSWRATKTFNLMNLALGR